MVVTTASPGDVHGGADHIHQAVHTEDDGNSFNRKTDLTQNHCQHHKAHAGTPAVPMDARIAIPMTVIYPANPRSIP